MLENDTKSCPRKIANRTYDSIVRISYPNVACNTACFVLWICVLAIRPTYRKFQLSHSPGYPSKQECISVFSRKLKLSLHYLAGVLETVVKTTYHDEAQQESCLHAAVMVLCRTALLVENMSASLHHKFTDIAGQIMFLHPKSAKLMHSSLQCIDQLSFRNDSPHIEIKAAGLLLSILARTKENLDALSSTSCAVAKNLINRILMTHSQSDEVEHLPMFALSTVVRALDNLVDGVEYTQIDEDSVTTYLGHTLQISIDQSVEALRTISRSNDSPSKKKIAKAGARDIFWMLAMATMWKHLAVKFVEAGGVQYLLKALINVNVTSSAAIASPLAMTFYHLCTLIADTSYEQLCCVFASPGSRGINALLEFIQSQFPAIGDDYGYHIILAIRSMVSKMNCGTSIQHACLLHTCSVIFSAHSKYPRSTTALIKLLATFYDFNLFFDTISTSPLAETIVESRFKSQLSARSKDYHEESIKSLLCIYPTPSSHNLTMSKKATREVLRLFRATIHDSRIISLLYALLWALVQFDDVRNYLMEQGTISLVSRSLYKHSWNMHTPFELLTRPGGQAPRINQGCLADLLAKLTIGFNVLQYVDVLKTLGSFLSGERLSVVDSGVQSLLKDDLIPARHEAFLESLETSCSVVGLLTHVREHALRLRETSILVYLIRIIHKMLHGVKTNTATKSPMVRVLHCCFYAIRRCIDILFISSCGDAIFMTPARDISDEGITTCDLNDTASIAKWKAQLRNEEAYTLIVQIIDSLVVDVLPEMKDSRLLPNLIKIVHKLSLLDPEIIYLFIDGGWAVTACLILSRQNIETLQKMHVLQTLVIGLTQQTHDLSSAQHSSTLDYANIINDCEFIGNIVKILKHLLEIGERSSDYAFSSFGGSEEVKSCAELRLIELCLRCTRLMLKYIPPDCGKRPLVIQEIIQKAVHLFLFGPIHDETIIQHCYSIARTMYTNSCPTQLARKLINKMHDMMQYISSSEKTAEQDEQEQLIGTEKEAHLLDELRKKSNLIFVLLISDKNREVVCDVTMKRLLSLVAEFVSSESSRQFWIGKSMLPPLTEIVLVGCDLLPKMLRTRVWKVYTEACKVIPIDVYVWCCTILLLGEYETTDSINLRTLLIQIKQSSREAERCMETNDAFALIFYLQKMAHDNAFMAKFHDGEFKSDLMEMIKDMLLDPPSNDGKMSSISIIVTIVAIWISNRAIVNAEEQSFNISENVSLEDAEVLLRWTLWCLHRSRFLSDSSYNRNEILARQNTVISHGFNRIVLTQTSIILTKLLLINRTFVREILQHQVTKQLVSIATSSYYSYDRKINFKGEVLNWVNDILVIILHAHGILFAEKFVNLSSEPVALVLALFDNKGINSDQYESSSECWASVLGNREDVWSSGAQLIKSVDDNKDRENNMIALYILLYRCKNDTSAFDEQSEDLWNNLLRIITEPRYITCQGPGSRFSIQQYQVRRLSLQIILIAVKKLSSSHTTTFWTSENADFIEKVLKMSWQDSSDARCKEEIWIAWLDLAVFQLRIYHRLPSIDSINSIIEAKLLALETISQHISQHKSTNPIKRLTTRLSRMIRRFTALIISHRNGAKRPTFIAMIKLLSSTAWLTNCRIECFHKLFSHSNGMTYMLDLLCVDPGKLQKHSSEMDFAHFKINEEVVLFLFSNIDKVRSSIKQIGKGEIQGILSMMNAALGASYPCCENRVEEPKSDGEKHPATIQSQNLIVACLTLLRIFVAKRNCALNFYQMDGLETLYNLIASPTQNAQLKYVQLALEISCYLVGHPEFADDAALPSFIRILYILIDHCSDEGSITALPRLAFLIIDQYVTHAATALTTRFAQECHTQLNEWKQKCTTRTINEKSHQVILKLYSISSQKIKPQNEEQFVKFPAGFSGSQIPTFLESQSMLEEAIVQGYHFIKYSDASSACRIESKAHKLGNTEVIPSDLYVDLDTGVKHRTNLKQNQLVSSAFFPAKLGFNNQKKTTALPAPCGVFANAVVRLNDFLLDSEIVTQMEKFQSFCTIIPALTSYIAFHSVTTDLVIVSLQIITKISFVSPDWVVGNMCSTKRATHRVRLVNFSAFLTACSLHVAESKVFALIMSYFCENIASEYAKYVSNTGHHASGAVPNVSALHGQQKKSDDLLKIAFFVIREWFEDFEIVRGGITAIWILMKMQVGRSLSDYAFLLNGKVSTGDENENFCMLLEFWFSVMRKHVHDEWTVWKCLNCLQFVLQFDIASNHETSSSSNNECFGSILLEILTLLTGLLQMYRKQTIILQMITIQLSTALGLMKLCSLEGISICMEIICRKKFLVCLIESVEDNADNETVVLESLRIIRSLAMYTFESINQASPSIQESAHGLMGALLSSFDEKVFCRALLQSFRHSGYSNISVTSLEILFYFLRFTRYQEVEPKQSSTDGILNTKASLKGGVISSPQVFQAILGMIEHDLADARIGINEAQTYPLSTTFEMSIDLLYDLIRTEKGQDWMDKLHGLDILCSAVDTMRIWIDAKPSFDSHEQKLLTVLDVTIDCIVALACYSQDSVLTNWKKAIPWLLSTAVWFQNQDETYHENWTATKEDSIYLLSLEKFIAILSALVGQTKYASSPIEPEKNVFYDISNEGGSGASSRFHFHLLQLLVNLDISSMNSTPSAPNESSLRRHIEIRLLSVIVQLCDGETEQLIFFLLYDGIPIVLERIYFHLHDPERLRLSMSFLTCLFSKNTDLVLPTTESQIRTTLTLIMQQYERVDKSIYRSARKLMSHFDKIDQDAIAYSTSSESQEAKDNGMESISTVPQSFNGIQCDAKSEQLRRAVQILSNSSTFRLRHVMRDSSKKGDRLQDESFQASLGEAETILVTLGYSREYFIFRSISVAEDPTFWNIFAALVNYRIKTKKGSYVQPDRIWLSQIVILPPLDIESCRQTTKSTLFPCVAPKTDLVPFERNVHLMVRQERIILEAESSQSCSEWKNALQTLLGKDRIEHANSLSYVDHQDSSDVDIKLTLAKNVILLPVDLTLRERLNLLDHERCIRFLTAVHDLPIVTTSYSQYCSH
uniref:AlNc14C13G1537 protein n=1 Tax=Albugo laibachii Nc14 TaxID=890382 RepID=F0W3H4_9STRA|nr:AlNc14C13G1537 [Albugo laibachii Nc14]|eukprot:CCA15617.1 AlNc14C13G1537 [Albugo laibachii Nc14]